jgi:hypothetical protein
MRVVHAHPNDNGVNLRHNGAITEANPAASQRRSGAHPQSDEQQQ